MVVLTQHRECQVKSLLLMVEDHKSPVAQLSVLSVSWDGSGLLGNGRGTGERDGMFP